MKRHVISMFFWSAVGLLVVSFALTIAGSSMNHDAVLNTGIIAWLCTSFLFFAWLVLWMWSRSSKYRK